MPKRPSFLFLNLGHALDHFVMLIYPTAVLTLHVAWGMSYGEALGLGTAAFATFALGTLPAGWLGDRWSREGMMAVFFLGTGVACLLTGLAAGPLTLTLGLGLIGLSASIYHPIATPLLVRRAEGAGRALGINGVFGNMGVAAAGGVTGLLTACVGWRAAFAVPGVLALLLGFAYVARGMAGREGPGDDADTATASRRALSPEAAGDARRVFAVVAVVSLFGGLVFHGATVALPKLFEERLTGVPGGVAGVGVAVSLVLGLAAFAQALVGPLLDRHGAKPVQFVLLLVQVPALALVGLAFGPGLPPAAFVMMTAVFGAIPVGDWLLGRHVPAAWRSRVYALKFVLSLGVGVVTAPLVAVTHAFGGFAALFTLLAAAAGATLVANLCLPGPLFRRGDGVAGAAVSRPAPR